MLIGETGTEPSVNDGLLSAESLWPSARSGRSSDLPFGEGHAHAGRGLDHVAQPDLLLEVGVEHVDRLRGAVVQREGTLPGSFGVRHVERGRRLALAVEVRADRARGDDRLAEAERHPLLERRDQGEDLARRARLDARAAVVLGRHRVVDRGLRRARCRRAGRPRSRGSCRCPAGSAPRCPRSCRG